jgi:hypothetical protein
MRQTTEEEGWLMADIGEPKRKIKIEPERRRERPPEPEEPPAPKREQPEKEPVRTGSR